MGRGGAGPVAGPTGLTGVMAHDAVGPPLPPEFFDRPTEELAYALLGRVLVHRTREGTVAGRIVELEMYRGPADRGAHTFGGRRTPRTEAMFGPPGRAYIYFIYGMHYCLNVVSAPEGNPEAILIRALEPEAGVDLMAGRRGWQGVATGTRQFRELANGPGKLTRAMAIDQSHYGHPLWQPPLYIARGREVPPSRVARGPRINIPYAREAREFPWRFWIEGNPFVSRA